MGNVRREYRACRRCQVAYPTQSIEFVDGMCNACRDDTRLDAVPEDCYAHTAASVGRRLSEAANMRGDD